MRLVATTLLHEQPRESDRRAQFPPFAALLSRDRDRFFKAPLRCRHLCPGFAQNHFRHDTMHFRLGPALAGFFHNLECSLERRLCRAKISKLEL